MKCEFCKIWLLVILIVFVGFYVTYQFIPPAPPKQFTLATGSTAGAYYAFGMEYKQDLLKQQMTVNVQPTAGSIDALHLLNEKKVDVAFVQGGTASDVPTEELRSLASLFYEPLWVFYRQEQTVNYLVDLKGKKVAVGAEGSGTRALAIQLLQESGIDEKNTTFLGLTGQEAQQQLETGEIDAAFFVVSPRATMISELFHNPAISLMNFKRAKAYISHYPFLNEVIISEGMIDLQQGIPAQDMTLLAATASLVVRKDIHPALIRLLLKEAEKIHSAADLLAAKNTFPSENYLEIPLHEEAKTYLRKGPSWLERVLPFWLASLLDRLKLMLIPLLTLLIPLLKSTLPIYRWRVRSKIYRWYETLRQVDSQIQSLDAHVIEQEIQRLSALHNELVTQVPIPLSYMAEFYNLRVHINLILTRLKERQAILLTQQMDKLI